MIAAGGQDQRNDVAPLNFLGRLRGRSGLGLAGIALNRLGASTLVCREGFRSQRFARGTASARSASQLTTRWVSVSSFSLSCGGAASKKSSQ
jgi:hypothetical protein